MENHKNVKKKIIFCTLKQTGTNMCSMGNQNSNFKIGLSLFGCEEKYTEKRTHYAVWHRKMSFWFLEGGAKSLKLWLVNVQTITKKYAGPAPRLSCLKVEEPEKKACQTVTY